MGPDLVIRVLKRCFWYSIFRQMRNRDAAVKSRERKKMYVKNLEIKSRYFEGECRRLEHLLQCCYAENHALRLCLQSRGAFGASMTMQESAVLLLGKPCNCKSYFLCFFSVSLIVWVEVKPYGWWQWLCLIDLVSLFHVVVVWPKKLAYFLMNNLNLQWLRFLWISLCKQYWICQHGYLNWLGIISFFNLQSRPWPLQHT